VNPALDEFLRNNELESVNRASAQIKNARVNAPAPDAAARSAALARQHGVTPEIVAASPDTWEATDDEVRAADTVRRAPALSQWLASDKFNAAISRDDLDPMADAEVTISARTKGRTIREGLYDLGAGLRDMVVAPVAGFVDFTMGEGNAPLAPAVREAGGVGEVAKKLGQRGIAGVGRLGQGALGVVRAAAEADAEIDPMSWAERAIFGRSSNDLTADAARAAERGVSGAVDDYSTSALTGNATLDAIGGGVESIPGSVAAVVTGAATKSAKTGAVLLGTITGGQSYSEGREQGLGVGSALAYGGIDASIETLTEIGPLGRLFRGMDAGDPAIKTFLRTLGSEAIGEQFATLGQDFNRWVFLDSNTGKTFGDFLAERPEAARDTLISSLVTTGAMQTTAIALEKGANLFGRTYARSFTSERDAQALDTLSKLAEASKVRGRDVGTFEAFIREASDGTEMTDVYVDAKQLAEVFNQSGIDPDMAVEMTGMTMAQIMQAVQTGSDVQIGIDRFAGRIAGTDAGNALLKHLRVDPGAMSQAEAEVFMQGAQAEFEAMSEEALKGVEDEVGARTSIDNVRDQMAEQLAQVGRFNSETNGVYATAYAQMLGTLGARVGLTAEEMAQRYQLLVQSGEVAEQTYDQSGLRLFHGSPRNDMTLDQIEIIRTEGQKQGKKGRVYGGFYGAAEDRLSDAEGYAGEGGTVYEIGLRPGAVVEEREGDITRLKQSVIEEYLARGVDVVVGKDPRGRTEYAIINRDAIQTFGARGATFNQDRVQNARAQKLADEVPGFAALLPYLNEDELDRIRSKRGAMSLVELFGQMPDPEEMASVAFSGRAKRGWYERSATALLDVFGAADAQRFAALLAATSPQTSVEMNAVNALSIWINWEKAGRPTDRRAILEIMGDSVQGGKGIGSVLDAWINNSVTALSAENPATIDLSGPKVNSFMLNLVGVMDEVTNDAWMANYALIDQNQFQGRRYAGENKGGKSPGYLAMSAAVRRAAEILTERTGETWTPAEVQETVWSWAKTLYEKGTLPTEILSAGGLTHEDIGGTPDFAQLFVEEAFRRVLEIGGYGEEVSALAENAGTQVAPEGSGDASSAQGSGVGEAAFFEHLRAAAQRLDRLKEIRNSAKAEDFTREKIGQILKKGRWSILTAENPMGVQGTVAANRGANKRLTNELKRRGLQYIPVEGSYGQKERSFIVLGIDQNEALAIGRMFEQDSVLTPAGLVYQDGSINPATGRIDVYEDAPADFYTKVPSTGALFTIGIDFDKTIPADVVDEPAVFDQSELPTDTKAQLDAIVAELGVVDAETRKKLHGITSNSNVRVQDDGTILAAAPAWMVNNATFQQQADVLGARLVADSDPDFLAARPTKLSSPPINPDGSITLQHYSATQDISVTDPSRWGQGPSVGKHERSQIGTAPNRTYFGIASGYPGGYREGNAAAGYIPSEGVALYETRIPKERLYDYARNPLGIERGSDKSKYETAIRDAGFAGYWANDSELGLVAVVFEPREVVRVNAEVYNQDAVFYSALTRAVEQSTTKRAPAQQWEATLRKSPGVKQEELEMSGLLDFLAMQEGPIPREAILDLLQNSGIVVEETVLGGDDAPKFQNWSNAPEGTPFAPSYREILLRLPQFGAEYDGSHWDQRDVVAHARVYDAFDDNGERTLVIDEVQSDWHQAGRDKGYAKTAPAAELEELARISIAATARVDALRELVFAGELSEDSAEFQDALRAEREAGQAQNAAQYPSGVADAPFKSTWPDLVMKRMIRWAVDNGYKQIAWTPGEQHVKRYNLGAATGPINAQRSGTEGVWKLRFNRDAMIRLEDAGLGDMSTDGSLEMEEGQMREAFGNNITQQIVEGTAPGDPATLAEAEAAYQAAKTRALDLLSGALDASGNENNEYMEAAREENRARLRLDEVRNTSVRLDGDNLSVGGEGMKQFYDKNLVNITNKLIKKSGAKVGVVGLDTLGPNRDARTELQGEIQARAGLAGYGVSTREEAETRIASLEAAGEDQRAESLRAALPLFDALEAVPPYTQHWGFEITPALAEQAASGFPLFQRDGRPRGQIAVPTDIAQNPTVITLLRGADLSTFVHELGHFYLEVMVDLASRPGTPKEIKDDVKAIMDWFGTSLPEWHRMSTADKREFHEKFARGHEAYLFEGNAPSGALREVFSKMRRWMMAVYQQLTQLNVELTPEVRGVFDRMYAAQDEIEAVQAEQGLMPFFDSKPEDMSEADWLAYQREGLDATQEAVGDLAARSLRDMQYAGRSTAREIKRLQREHKERRAVVREEVEAELSALPVYQASRYLRTGRLSEDENPTSEPHKLLTPLVREALQLDASDPMPTALSGMTSTKNGVHPQQIADLFGFTSMDHLLKDLLFASPLTDAIDAETDQRMRDRYGELNSQEDLERAAQEAVHNDVRGRFVATELAAIEKAPGKKRVLTAAAKSMAEKLIGQKRIRDLRPAQFEAAERRAAKEALKTRGDIAKAAMHKRNQLLQFHLAKEAHAAREEAEKARDYLRKFDKTSVRKNLDKSYRDQIDQLLERFQLRQISDAEADRRSDLTDWIEKQRAAGFEPVVSPEWLDQVGRKAFRDMTIDEMRGLVDAVKNIEHMARLTHKLLTAKDNADLAQVVGEIGQSVRDNATTTVPEIIGAKTWFERVKSGAKDFLAMHRKVANMVYVMDGAQYGGAFWNRFIRPMNEAGDRETEMNADATRRLKLVFDLLKGDDTTKRVYEPAVNASLSLEDRLMVALNMGNSANLQRLLDGDKWTYEQVQAVIAPLTSRHWDFVEQVWEFVDSFWADTAAKEERVSGVAPAKVEAEPFQVEIDGELRLLRGGYFPIKYDPARSSKAEADTAADVQRQIQQGLYTRATTRRGHTKERVDSVKGRPLRKDFGVIFQHTSQVIHDLSWHEYLIDANRLLRAGEIDDAIRTHYGPETLRWMRKALEDIAVGDLAAQNAIESGVNYLRQGVSIAGLGWNLWTAMLQPLGLTQSMSRIGSGWVLRGLGEIIGSPSAMNDKLDWIYERSPMMRSRGETMQREVNEIRNSVSAKSPLRKTMDKAIPAEVSDAIADSYFWMIAKGQLIADIPTWLGMYQRAMSEGKTEDTAIALADQSVIDSQSGGMTKDLAGVQRGSPLLKLWTNFYSYFSATYNLLVDRKEGFKRNPNMPALMWDVMLLTVVPATLSGLLKVAFGKEDPEDEEELLLMLGKENFSYMTGMLIGLRDVGSAITSESGWTGPAGGRLIAESGRLIKQVEQGEADEAAFRAANSVGGILLHYPSGQVDRTARGTMSVVEGDAGPQALLVGPPRK
jgi:hypothetical protein